VAGRSSSDVEGSVPARRLAMTKVTAAVSKAPTAAATAVSTATIQAAGWKRSAGGSAVASATVASAVANPCATARPGNSWSAGRHDADLRLAQ